MPIASPPTTYQLERPGCSGIACGPYLSIRDPLNIEKELKRGATGAVSVKGLPTFKGYEKIADKSVPLDTSAFSSEGWFDTGDCGFMDDDGYLYITGRSKEIINRGGEVISPFEIEEAILVVAKDRVKTTIAFSVDHDVLQEAIGVVIVPQPEAPRISLAELVDLLKEQLHPSKWPFLVVYMDDLPKNNAGKPLRIKLASRLNLGMTNDSFTTLERHYEAIAPDKNVPLSEPIPSSRVSIQDSATERKIADIEGIEDSTVRRQQDGTLEAFVYTENSSIDAGYIKGKLRGALHGYCLPDSFHIFDKPFPRKNNEIDLHALEEIIKEKNASQMSPRALLVRDIVAELLQKDPALISGTSDFFLIGGNSLLLGRLSYSIRKETGASLKVADLFNHSTMNGIAALIDEQTTSFMASATARAGGNDWDGQTPTGSRLFEPTKGLDGMTGEGPGVGSRSQTHPLCLMVQIFPLLFFYPLKAAWNCKSSNPSYRRCADKQSRDRHSRISRASRRVLGQRLLVTCYCSHHIHHHRSRRVSYPHALLRDPIQVGCYRKIQGRKVSNVSLHHSYQASSLTLCA